MLERIAGRLQQIALWTIGFLLVGIGLLTGGFAVYNAWLPFFLAASGLFIVWIGVLVISAAR